VNSASPDVSEFRGLSGNKGSRTEDSESFFAPLNIVMIL
jgi:hypothetical protein